MIKRILSLLFAVALLAIAYSLYISTTEQSYTLHSNQGCCYINVIKAYDDNKDEMYIVLYNTNDESDDDKSIVSTDELDETINMYQEYCYHYHQW